MISMKKKMILVFSSMFSAFLLLQSCSTATIKNNADPLITEIETTEAVVIEESTSNTEVFMETIEETFPLYLDTAIVSAEMESRHGMIGRLIIPDVGVDVALFNRYTQSTVDNKDSAGTYRYNGGQMVIADHKNQGFSAMKGSIPGQTIAYINDGETIKTYICVDNDIGSNKSNGIPYDLLDCNGNSIYMQNTGGMCMYTCNDHWSRITYTYWQPFGMQ